MKTFTDQAKVSTNADQKARPSYAEKRQDTRWQQKRLALCSAAGWRCQECHADDHRALQVHHIVYIPGVEPWEYPDSLLLVLCDQHHRERQAMEQAIFMKVGEHLAGLTMPEMRQQPIYAFFEDDSTLNYLPAWQRELLRYENNLEAMP